MVVVMMAFFFEMHPGGCDINEDYPMKYHQIISTLIPHLSLGSLCAKLSLLLNRRTFGGTWVYFAERGPKQMQHYLDFLRVTS